MNSTAPIHNSSISLLGGSTRFDLVISLTLLLLLLYPHRYWYVNIPLSVFAVAGFIFPVVRRSALLWFLVTIVIFIGTVINWYALDNHKYLLAYWCLAVACSLTVQNPQQVLAISARWLIFLVFALAVLQKIKVPHYLDSSFFYYELLFDSRFHGLAKYLAGMPEHMQTLNEAARRALINYDSLVTQVNLESTPRMSSVAAVITWWNLLIQVFIALAFIFNNDLLCRCRNVLLLIFLFTTYLFAPVVGFGWVLAIMGLAQVRNTQTRMMMCYLAAFLFLQVYRIPWGEILRWATV